MPEVDTITDGLAGDSHVIAELRFMIGREFCDGLQFDDETVKTKRSGM